MKKVKMIGSVLLYIAVYFLIFLTVSNIWFGKLLNDEVIGNWISQNEIGIVILNDVIALPIFMLVIYLLKKKSIFKVTKFKRIGIKHVILCIAIGICMGVFLTNFFKLPFMKEIPEFEDIMVYIYDSNLLMFLGFVFIGTFFKEMLFRGLLLNELKKEMNLVLAILIHGLLYGAMFFFLNVPLTLFSLLGNVVVALVYIHTGSIWGAYLAQAFNNFTAYLIRNTNPELFGDMQVLFVSLSVLGMVISLYFIYKSKNSVGDCTNIGEAA